MNAINATERKVVYWHGELPPQDAQMMGEHAIDATSRRRSNTMAEREDIRQRCYDDLRDQARERIEQEVARLGGAFAHILDESVDERHDDRTAQAWLHGRFTYALYSEKGK